MMTDQQQMLGTLQRIEQRLVSVERWLRFSNMERLRGILSQELGEDAKKKLAFESSDGSRGYREVGELAGVPAATVQGWWGRWFTMGIMEASQSRAGRVQRICSLKEVGLDVPTVTSGKAKASVAAGSKAVREQAQLSKVLEER